MTTSPSIRPRNLIRAAAHAIPVLVLAWTTGSVTAQSVIRNITVDATVKTPAGDAVADAEVRLEPVTEGRTLKKAKTKNNGQARIPLVENGEYKFGAVKTGLEPYRIKVDVLLTNKQVEDSAGGDLPPGAPWPSINVGPGRTVRLEIVLGPPRANAAAPAAQPESDRIGDASRLTSEKKYDESDALLAPVLAADPADAKALYLKGLNANGRGDAATAREALTKAMESDPTLPGVRATLAQIAYKEGDKAAALGLFQGEAELAPDEPSLALDVAVLLDELGKKKEAVAAYETAIALDPANAAAYGNLAALYSDLGEPAKAEATLKKMEAVGNPDPTYWFNIGADYSNSDQPEKAEAAYRKALALDPGFPEANRELGFILVRKGDVDGARKSFEKYLALRPDAKDAADIRSLLKSL
jgi:Flp pilus assembly protein TadD